MPSRVQTAHGGGWEVQGRLRAGTRALHGIRCMASGLPHPQWNNGDGLLERGLAAGAQLAHLHPDTDEAARIYCRLGFVETEGIDVYVNLFANQ